jgi:hypothetical protein
LAKNSAAEATSFQNTTTTTARVFNTQGTETIVQIKKSFKYENISNKFDLENYERELKINLAETIADELIFKLSNIQ